MEAQAIFEPYRAIGTVTGDAPFSVHSRGRVGFVTTIVGRTWHLYTLAKLQLKLVGPEHPGLITKVVNKGDLTIAAVGSMICVSKRAHLTQQCEEDADGNFLEKTHGNVVDLVLVGDYLLSLHEKGKLVRWRITKRSKEAEAEGEGEAEEGGRLVYEDAIDLDTGFSPSCLCHPPAYLNKVIVGCRDDGRAQLWNVMTKKLVYAFDFGSGRLSDDEGETNGGGEGTSAGVVDIVASPALDVVAVVLGTNDVILHNLKFDETVTDFGVRRTRGNAVTCVAFSAGTGLPLLAVGTTSGAILVFDLDRRQLHCVMGASGGGSDVLAHSQRVRSVQFLHNKPILMSCADDNSVKQWAFEDSAKDNQPKLLRYRQGHSLPPTLVRHYDSKGGDSHQQSSDSVSGSKLLSCSVDRTFRVFSAHKDDQSFEMSQRSVARRAKRIKISDSSDLKLGAVRDLAFCALRENDWCNVVTAHEGETCAYTWRLGKQALGEFTLQPPLSEYIPFMPKGQVIETHSDAQELMKRRLLSPVTSVAISSCGHYALVGCRSGRIDRYNLQSGFHRGAFYRYDRVSGKISTAHDAEVSGIECDAYNKEVYSVGADDKLRIWGFSAVQVTGRAKSAGRKGDLMTHEETLHGKIARLANHKHSSLLALVVVGDGGGGAQEGKRAPAAPEICVYDTWAKKVVRRLNNRKKSAQLVHKPGASVNDLGFSLDGKWLLTCASDRLIAIWDVPGSQVLQVLRVPDGSSCVSLSLSPGKTMLATAHEGCKGIYLWSNVLVSRPGTNLALSHSSRAVPVDLPMLDPQQDTDGVVMAEAGDDSDGDEGDLLDVHMDVGEGGSVSLGLVTLSDLPRSHWHGLMFQDEIKERNKPKEQVNKPERAPFFLPTVSSMRATSWDLDAEVGGEVEGEGEDGKGSSKIVKGAAGGGMGSGLTSALASGDHDAAIASLKTLSPGQIYTEIFALDREGVLGALEFCAHRIAMKTDFELLQAVLSTVLKVHMGDILGDRDLSDRAAEVREALGEAWGKMEGRLQRVTCLLSHFSNMN